MSDFEGKALALLASIDASMKALVAAANRRAAAGGGGGVAVADDRDLDSQYGDEKIKFDPKDWKGESMKGLTMSRCPADYLEMLASSYDYFASKNAKGGDEKKAGYDRRAAARARGWSRRLLSGWKPSSTSTSNGGGSSGGGFDGDGSGLGDSDPFAESGDFGGAEDF